MKLGIDFTTHLQDADHFEMLGSLEESLQEAACNINTIHNEFEGISEARQELAINLAKLEVYKEIIRMKLSVMDGEWSDRVAEAMGIIESEYGFKAKPKKKVTKKVEVPTISNMDDLI